MSVTSIPLKNGRIDGKVTKAEPPRDGRAAAMDGGADALTAEDQAHLDRLRKAYGHLEAEDLLRVMIGEVFPGEIVTVSSFGAESAVLLHMISRIDPTVPVLFLDTGKLFGETLKYRARLQRTLGLADMRTLHPHPGHEAERDPKGDLWARNPDACCHFRKVQPLERGLKGFAAEITGRKRFQTGARAQMPRIEISKGRFKINPLADWSLEDLNAYVERHNLPRHPLVAEGYLSIGCMPCTDRVKAGGDYRSGRWAGQDKDECGIHLPENIDGDGI